MYQFRLVIGGCLIGDAEPCIIGSAIRRLGNLNALSDPRLSLGLSDPSALIRLVAATGALGPVATAVIEPSGYDPLLEMARTYWGKLETAAGPGYGPSPVRVL